MYDDNQMTDSAELLELSDALSGVPMPRRPPLEAIEARGRARRRQRLARVASLSVAGFAASAALALGASGALSPATKLGTIRTAAFTLRHNHNGTDTLTLNPGELFDPAQLQSDLAKYNIPAKVTSGSFCTSVPEPAGFSAVVTGPGPGTWQQGSRQQPTITIDPSQMPTGTELSFGDFQLTTGEYANEQQADATLIDTNSYTCTSIAPVTPGPGGFQATYGGQAGS